jgi:hypothetical protein
MNNLELIVRAISRRVLPMAPAIDKAKAVYDWMIDNIEYDHDRKKSIDDGIDRMHFDPEDVIERGKGVCSDMAVLYVALARGMGLSAHYALVETDCFGKDICHACAVVDLQTKQLQVDPAYKQFDARHQKYKIQENRVKPKQVINSAKKKLHWARYAAAGIAAVYGIFSYLSSATGSSGSDRVTMLEIQNETRFVSQNGVFNFTYGQETAKTLREYLFFSEAKRGCLGDKELLNKYLEADQNNDSKITLEEAVSAAKSARDEYNKKKN